MIGCTNLYNLGQGGSVIESVRRSGYSSDTVSVASANPSSGNTLIPLAHEITLDPGVYILFYTLDCLFNYTGAEANRRRAVGLINNNTNYAWMELETSGIWKRMYGTNFIVVEETTTYIVGCQ